MNNLLKHVLLAPLLLFAAICLSACAPAAKPQPVDLSKPQTAALDYVKALQRGDAVTARAASMGTEQEMRWIDALASSIDGMRQLNNALYERFGPATSQLHTDLEESLRIMADEPVDLISHGSIRMNATQAVISPTVSGFTARDQVPIAVTKVSTRAIWKVDLARTYVPDPPRESLRLMNDQQRADFSRDEHAKISVAMRKYQEAADVFHAVAKELRAGKYKTSEEAERSLAGRVQGVIGSAKK